MRKMKTTKRQYPTITASMRPILQLGRLFGLAPYDMGWIPLKAASIFTLAVALVVVLSCFWSVRISFNEFTIGNQTLQSFITECFLMAVTGITSVIILVTSMTKAGDMKLLYETLEKIDADLFKTTGSKPSQNHRKYLIFEIALVVFLLFGWYVGAWFGISSSLNYIQVSFEILTLLICFITLIEFLNFVYIIRVRCSTINKAIFLVLGLKEPFFFKETTETRFPKANKITTVLQNPANLNPALKTLRIIHCQIYSTVELINEIFGLKILGLFSNNLIDLIDTVYTIISESTIDQPESSYLYSLLILYSCWLVIIVLIIVFTSLTCHSTSEEADMTLMVLQQCLLLDKLSDDTESSLEKFCRQVERGRFLFTACGLFVLDKAVVLSVTSTVCTYMIVLTTINVSL